MPPRRIYEHSGPAELVLEGENLTPDTLKLYHNGVLYTPLQSSDTYAYYLLGDNGTNKVMLNGKNFCTVIVKDVVVPDSLPNSLSMFQFDLNEGALNTRQTAGNCINYPFMYNEVYKYFVLRVGSSAKPFTDYSGESWAIVNGTFNNRQAHGDNSVQITCQVTDPTKPAYITYKGFIIAVFNYSA